MKKMQTGNEMRSGCPINLTLEMIGDRWSLIVIRDRAQHSHGSARAAPVCAELQTAFESAIRRETDARTSSKTR
jgi:DNA-binding HxlR family transcriptional regulator